jgi:hypothetical protein
LVLGSIVSLWLLFGFTTGIVLAIIVLVGVIFSRDLNRGITTSIREKIFQDLPGKKEVFLGELEKELKRRGLVPKVPLEKNVDLIYRDFFNEVRIYVSQEESNVRLGYRISATPGAIALGVLLLIPFVVGSIVLFALAILKRTNTQQTIDEAGLSAAILSRGNSSLPAQD